MQILILLEKPLPPITTFLIPDNDIYYITVKYHAFDWSRKP